MTDARITLERRGAIGELVLNRPAKRNALNRAIWRAIPTLLAEVEADPALKVLIVRGAGGEAFSAGADIAEFDEVHRDAETALAYNRLIRAAYDAVTDLSKPTVAEIRGVCFGGGCALALCCDLRYADETARFCIPPARLGLAYTLFETKRLADLVGPAKAKEMLMGARIVAADEALAIGLATRLFDADSLAAETRAFAESLCGLSQFTIRAVKQVIAQITDGATDDNAVSEALVIAAFDGPDYREGREAFLQKRPPRFGQE